MSFVGDSISNLAIDANETNPSQMSNFMNILNQIQSVEPLALPSQPTVVNTVQPMIKEKFATEKVKISYTKSFSVAITLTIIMVILTLEPVQKLLDKVFKTKMTKIGVQALVFCLLSVVLIHKL
jgi:hypothetical protein